MPAGPLGLSLPSPFPASVDGFVLPDVQGSVFPVELNSVQLLCCSSRLLESLWMAAQPSASALSGF